VDPWQDPQPQERPGHHPLTTSLGRTSSLCEIFVPLRAGRKARVGRVCNCRSGSGPAVLRGVPAAGRGAGEDRVEEGGGLGVCCPEVGW
jgi:hypothetical protein